MKHIFQIPIHTKTYYNPITNKLQTGFSSSNPNSNWQNVGFKKVAEAFTSVTPEERKVLWKSYDNRTYSFDFSMFNSKLRHKLKRLGLYQLSEKPLSKGKNLLKKINNKKLN
jgi:hypothetical protein